MGVDCSSQKRSGEKYLRFLMKNGSYREEEICVSNNYLDPLSGHT